jgi:hypothetical protein
MDCLFRHLNHSRSYTPVDEATRDTHCKELQILKRLVGRADRYVCEQKYKVG